MTNWISFIGILAGCCTTGSAVPQMLKIIKTKKTRDISLMMYCVVTIGVILWITYGLLIKNFPIVFDFVGLSTITNCILLFFAVLC